MIASEKFQIFILEAVFLDLELKREFFTVKTFLGHRLYQISIVSSDKNEILIQGVVFLQSVSRNYPVEKFNHRGNYGTTTFIQFYTKKVFHSPANLFCCKLKEKEENQGKSNKTNYKYRKERT